MKHGGKYKIIKGGSCMATILKESVAIVGVNNNSIGDVSNDDLLQNMKNTGKHLRKILNITSDDIQKALRESREEWK